MNCNYIEASSSQTIQKLKNYGFVVLGEKDGVTVFLNNPKWLQLLGEDDDIVFTNQNRI